MFDLALSQCKLHNALKSGALRGMQRATRETRHCTDGDSLDVVWQAGCFGLWVDSAHSVSRRRRLRAFPSIMSIYSEAIRRSSNSCFAGACLSIV